MGKKLKNLGFSVEIFQPKKQKNDIRDIISLVEISIGGVL